MTTMRERAFSVWLNDARVGSLVSHDDYTRFVLDRDYVRSPDRAVLGLRFEENLMAQHRSNLRLPTWFSNLLPEGRLREWIARARGVSENREMQLLAEVGHDLPGAVRVLEDDNASAVDSSSIEDTILHHSSHRRVDNMWRFSLAGVALKLSMLQRHERFTAPSVGEGGDWIVKLPDRTHACVPLNEYAMMTLAQRAGIDTPDIRLVHRDQLEGVPEQLWPGGEEQAYAVRRFDRTPARGRVHIEDMAQVRGFYPEDKYKGSFETVAALVYRGRDASSLLEFAKRLAFNILIGNGDAHLKNWSLIYRDPRIPILSPAYDLVATAVYRPNTEPEDLGLRFGGSRRFETISLATFERLRGALGAEIDLASAVRDLVNNVLKAWPEVEALLHSHVFLRDGIFNTIAMRAKLLSNR